MRTGIIGAGKVGCSLGKYFRLNNLKVTGYYDVNENLAKEAATFTERESLYVIAVVLYQPEMHFPELISVVLSDILSIRSLQSAINTILTKSYHMRIL